MFELIRRDKNDHAARDAVRRLDSAAECLHTAKRQTEVCSPGLADQIARAFMTVAELYEDAADELNHHQEGQH